MDSNIKREIILDNYNNPFHKGLLNDKNYSKGSKKSQTCIDNFNIELLIKDNIIKNMSDKKQLLCMRIMLVVFLAISVIIALDPPTFIAQLMGISWGALAGAFLAPFMYGLYWKGVTKASVWASFIVGVGITVANMFFKFIASPINAGAVAMVAGLIVVPIVSLITPKMKKEKLDEVFACLDETVVVHRKNFIEE